MTTDKETIPVNLLGTPVEEIWDDKWMAEMCQELRDDIDATIAQGTSFEEICKLKVGIY